MEYNEFIWEIVKMAAREQGSEPISTQASFTDCQIVDLIVHALPLESKLRQLVAIYGSTHGCEYRK